MAGGSYQFRYRVENIHGWGPWSDVVIIAAADIPDAPVAVTTTIADVFVKVALTAPNDRSSAIIEYEVLIQHQDGSTFSAMTTYCDGSLPVVVSSRYCLIPMSALRASPISLVYPNLVVAKYKAKNAIGWGAYSPENSSGATI